MNHASVKHYVYACIRTCTFARASTMYINIPPIMLLNYDYPK